MVKSGDGKRWEWKGTEGNRRETKRLWACPRMLMKIMRTAADEVFVVEAFDVMGFDGDDVVNVLETASDEEEGFLGDDEAEFFEEVRINDGV